MHGGDAHGCARGNDIVNEEDAFAGKRSSKRAVSVPDEAEEAQFVLDCRCKGVCDLAVPYFSAEKERTKKKKRNLKQ